MSITKTTTVEIFFEDLKNDFPELRDQNGDLIKDRDKLLEVAETLDDNKILEKDMELSRYLHNNYHRFDSVNLPEYFGSENLKIIDSNYFGEIEGIVLTIEYDFDLESTQ